MIYGSQINHGFSRFLPFHRRFNLSEYEGTHPLFYLSQVLLSTFFHSLSKAPVACSFVQGISGKMPFRSFLLVVASIASAAVIRRGDPGFQEIPSSAQADNTFNNGAPLLAAEPPMETTQPMPAVYGSRSIDLPFGRLYHGKMKFFSKGQLNTPDGITDKWIDQPNVVDSAKQSACGIPDNAFSISKVAIHPYFLKFAPLDREWY